MGERVGDWLIAAVGIAVLAAFVLPAVQWSRPRVPSAATVCKNNLKMIGLALHNYHGAYGSFPPAVVTDAEGRPLHSWRVLLLPFLDETHLYEQYRWDEPWDGPHNRELAKRIPQPYRCPKDPHSVRTRYLAVAGPGTAFDGSSAIRLDAITDGISRTMVVVETPGDPVHWMEPRDISPAELLEQWHSPAATPRHPQGIHVLKADGTVRGLETETPADRVRALTTVAGGEPVDNVD